MKTLFPVLIVTAAALLTGCQTVSQPAPAADAGRVTVTFQAPEKFSDFRDSFTGSDKGREYYMTLIRDCLKGEARRFLAEGQTLSVTFTDIDLAGDYLPSMRRGLDDIRVVKEIYYPRMTLTFELRDAAGAVVKQGDRKLIDMNFMSNPSFQRSEVLFYDLELLRDWLRTELR